MGDEWEATGEKRREGGEGAVATATGTSTGHPPPLLIILPQKTPRRTETDTKHSDPGSVCVHFLSLTLNPITDLAILI